LSFQIHVPINSCAVVRYPRSGRRNLSLAFDKYYTDVDFLTIVMLFSMSWLFKLRMSLEELLREKYIPKRCGYHLNDHSNFNARTKLHNYICTTTPFCEFDLYKLHYSNSGNITKSVITFIHGCTMYKEFCKFCRDNDSKDRLFGGV
jgi:hypothetical protein